jgi:hypothetical protein
MTSPLTMTSPSTLTLSFVIPSVAEGSAVPRTSLGNAEHYAQTELSSRSVARLNLCPSFFSATLKIAAIETAAGQTEAT